MDLRVGMRLSSLSMDMLKPGKTKEDKQFLARVLAMEDVERLQKEQKLALLNGEIDETDDVDAFFLKFAKHRNSAVTRSVSNFVRVMNDDADKRAINDNLSTGPDDVDAEELKRMEEKYDADLGEILAAGHTDNNTEPMTDAEIEYFKMRLEAGLRQSELGPDTVHQKTDAYAVQREESTNKADSAAEKTAEITAKNQS